MILPPPRLRVLAVFQERGVTIHDYLFNYLWKNFAIRLDCMRIEEVRPAHVQAVDLVLIAACNAAFHQDPLSRIGHWAQEAGKAMLNRPDALRNCQRVPLSRLMHENGIDTARVQYVSTRDDLLENGMLRYPLIIRNELSHLGSTMIWLETIADAVSLDESLFGPHTVAIEFHDYRDADGLYRKYRCALVGDAVLPRHVISSHEWNIHSETLDEKRLDEHRAENRAFRERELHEADPLHRAKALTGLDYAIADYALGQDGRVFLFEMNPCYSIMDPSAFKRPMSPSLRGVHDYCRAFGQFLHERAGHPMVAQPYATEPLVL